MTRDSRKEKEGVSQSVVSDSFATRGLEPTRLRILQATMLEWVAMLFFQGIFPIRDGTQGSCTVGRFFIV